MTESKIGNVKSILTDEQRNSLTAIVNVGVEKAAIVLQEMIGSNISLQIPFIKVVSLQNIESETKYQGDTGPLSAVRLDFRGPFEGTAALVFPPESAEKIVSALIGDEPGSPAPPDSEVVSTLTEVGNIVMNGVMGSIGNALDKRIDYAVPSFTKYTVKNIVSTTTVSKPNTRLLMAQTRFTVEELKIDGDIMLYFEIQSFDELVALLSNNTTV